MEYNFNEMIEELPTHYTLGYGFFNPNPRGCRTGDCVKRAIVVATGKDYKEIEIFMKRERPNKSRPYNDEKNAEAIVEKLGGKILHYKPQAGKLRWNTNNIMDLIGDYAHLTFIFQTSHHWIGVRCNTVFDLWRSDMSDKCIYKLMVFGANEDELKNINDKLQIMPKRRFVL